MVTEKQAEKRLLLQIKSGRILDIFWAFFNKTIIPLGLVGYDMIITNSALPALLALTISYPTSANGIIVKYQIMSLNQGQLAIITRKKKENA